MLEREPYNEHFCKDAYSSSVNSGNRIDNLRLQIRESCRISKGAVATCNKICTPHDIDAYSNSLKPQALKKEEDMLPPSHVTDGQFGYIVNHCRQFLEMKGHSAAAEDLACLISQENTLKPSGITSCNNMPLSYAAAEANFTSFCGWIGKLIDDCQQELVEVAYVAFVELWLKLLNEDTHSSQEFFKKFSVYFSSTRAEIQDMRIILNPAFIAASLVLQRWKNITAHCIEVCNLAHKMLLEYLALSDLSFQALLLSKISFEIRKNHRKGSRLLGRTRAHDVSNCHKQVSWGLYLYPSNCVEPISNTNQTATHYLDTEAHLARINGEITQPTKFSGTIPLANDSQVALERWLRWNTELSCSWVQCPTLNDFPSILNFELGESIKNIGCVKISEISSGCWIGIGHEDGSITMLNTRNLTRPPYERFDNIEQHERSFDKISVECQESSSGMIEDTSSVPSYSKTQTPLVLSGHKGLVTSLSFLHPSTPHSTLSSFVESHMISGSNDGCIRLWNLDDGIALSKYEAHLAPILCLDTTWSGNYFVAGSADTTASLWSFSRPSPIRMFQRQASRISVG